MFIGFHFQFTQDRFSGGKLGFVHRFSSSVYSINRFSGEKLGLFIRSYFHFTQNRSSGEELGLFIGFHFQFTQNRFSCEKRSSSSEEPQKKKWCSSIVA